MKTENKYIKYFLIAGVAAVWGIIVVQVVKGFGGNDKPVLIKSNFENVNYAVSKDTFSLQANYPDPFIPSGDSLNEPAPKINVPNLPPAIDSSKIVPDYSFIRYVGLISGASKKSSVAIINFRGNDVMLKEKGKLEDFTLKKIEKTQLIFVHKGKTIKVKRDQVINPS